MDFYYFLLDVVRFVPLLELLDLREKVEIYNRVGRLPTSEPNWKIIQSDKVRCRIGKD
jgi:hypothetical protein